MTCNQVCIIVSHYHTRIIVQVRDRHNQELQEQVQTKDREIATHRHHFQQQQDEIEAKNGQIQHQKNTIQTLTTQIEVGRPDLALLAFYTHCFVCRSYVQISKGDCKRKMLISVD